MLHKFTNERIAELWQAEQVNKILLLPIAIGDKVYEIVRTFNYEDNTADDWEQQTGFEIKAREVYGIAYKEICGTSPKDKHWFVIDYCGEEYLFGSEEAMYPFEDVKAIYDEYMENFNQWVANGRPKC